MKRQLVSGYDQLPVRYICFRCKALRSAMAHLLDQKGAARMNIGASQSRLGMTHPNHDEATVTLQTKFVC